MRTGLMVVAQEWSVSVVGNWSSDNLLHVCGGCLVDDCIESVVVIGGVINGTHGTVGFDEGVLSLNNISVALFGLGLDVTGVWVLDSIVERVLGVRLLKINIPF